MSIRLLANVLSLSKRRETGENRCSSQSAPQSRRVATRWTWLRAPLGSGDAAPPPREVLTSGAGLAPPPAGVLSPTLGSLGQEHSGQKARRGPRKRSCDLRAVAARQKERTKRAVYGGPCATLSSSSYSSLCISRLCTQPSGWPGSTKEGVHAAAARRSQHLLRVPERAFWPLCSRPTPPRVGEWDIGHAWILHAALIRPLHRLGVVLGVSALCDRPGRV